MMQFLSLKNIFTLFCGVILTAPILLWGNIRFDQISIEDGLSQSTVYCITQDTLGFIWIGTQDGLNKYDGYNFTVYKHNPYDTTTISDNYITSLLMDKSGNLWIGTFGGGLNRFDFETETFIRYPYAKTPTGNFRIRDIMEDRSGKLWLGTSGAGLFSFNPATENYTRYQYDPKNPQSLSNNYVWTIAECPSRDIWVGTDGGGLCKLDVKTGKFTRYRHQPKNLQHSPSGNSVRKLYWDHRQNLWIGMVGSGLSKMQLANDGNHTFTHFSPESGQKYPLSSKHVWQIMEDRNKHLWIGTRDGGLCLYTEGRNGDANFTPYRHNPAEPQSIINNIIIELFEDRSGIIWVGAFGGISKFNTARNKFTHIKKQAGASQSMSHNVVMTMHEDASGSLWAGTFGGLNKIDFAPSISPKFSQFHELPVKAINHFKHDPQNRFSLTENRIWCITEDAKKQLWVGTLSGLNRMVGEKNRFVRYVHQPKDLNSISANRIWSLYTDRQGNLWIGTDGGGLNWYDAERDQFYHFKHDPDDPSSISHNTVRAFEEDTDGNLWIGTFGGGINMLQIPNNPEIIRNKQLNFEQFRNDVQNQNSLMSNRIFSLKYSKSGYLWIGTGGGGLNRYDWENDEFVHYTEAEGLPNNVVYGILEDENGFLWLSTNNGISKFDPSTKNFRNYSVDDGLQSNEFNQGAYHKGASTGKMFLGGINGLNAFAPKDVKDNLQAPPIVLTAFKKFDQLEKIAAAVSKDQVIELSYQENFFAFEFAALDYTNPAKNAYAYKLEGFDKDWVYCGNRRYTSYTNLDGGDYVFRVKGANSDGVWNEKGVSVRIHINPPFWKTIWFQFGVILLFTLGLILFYQYRINKVLAVERTRLRIARDLHDEVSATLSSISYFAQAIHNALPNRLPETPGKFLALITESATEAQDAMNDIIWSINPKNDEWHQLFAKFRRYAADLMESRNIKYEMEMPPLLPARKLSMDQRRRFWMIFKEIITNTAKHSECSVVTVSFVLQESQIQMTITDDGIGFDPQKPTERSGVKNINARAQALNAKLDLKTAPGKGTRWALAFRY